MVNASDSPGEYLKSEFGILLYRLPLPIGLTYTDQLMDTLSKLAGRPIPLAIEKQRARYLDAMIDAHKHNALGRLGVFGDPELVYAVSTHALETGFKLTVAGSGPACEPLMFALKRLEDEFETTFTKLEDTDFETIEKYVLSSETNLLVGPSDGAYMTEKHGIPLIRLGFPVHDRMGAQRKISIGYFGSLQLLD